MGNLSDIRLSDTQRRVVRIGGEEHEFESFVDPVTLIVNALIFDGKTYPIVDFIDDVRVIMDVGANVGAASLFLSAHYPTAAVYAFEPARETFALLERNMRGQDNVTCFPFGLYDRSVDAKLEIGDEGPGTATARLDGGDSQDERIRLRSTADWLRDKQIGRVDILKLDTEGCEVPILRAMRQLIVSMKVIYLEYHSEDDRKIVDELVGDSHVLVFANVYRLHRGELTYVAKESFPSREDLLRGEIRVEI